jgi:ketosteroid isomerase-like protein
MLGLAASKGDRIMEITKEEVSRIHREDFYRALKQNDLEKLTQIYSDDYMLVRPDGSAFSKTQILDDLRSHSMSFNSIALTNEKIRIYGSVAVLTGDSKITSVRDGLKARASFGSSPFIAKEVTASSSFIFRVALYRRNLRSQSPVASTKTPCTSRNGPRLTLS